MPMSWTPENDRLLLLKLVETHGISINAEAIVKAWPNGTEKPTPRAIKERFVRLRALAGVKGTPSKARVIQPKTPASSAKKRKVQEDTESDAEDHYTTEEETPVKHKSIRRGAATLGSRGNRKGIRNNNTRTHIKQELPENASFDELSTRASELSAKMNDPFDTIDTIAHGDPFISTDSLIGDQTYYNLNSAGGGGTLQSFGEQGLDFSPTDSSGFGMGLPAQNPIAMSASYVQLGQMSGGRQGEGITARTVPATNNGVQPARSSLPPSDKSHSQHPRSARKASQQASDEMAAWHRVDKAQAHQTYGEKMSDEDCQVSEFQQSDDDYI